MNMLPKPGGSNPPSGGPRGLGCCGMNGPNGSNLAPGGTAPLHT